MCYRGYRHASRAREFVMIHEGIGRDQERVETGVRHAYE